MTLQDAEKMKGKKLTSQEKMIFEVFSNKKNYKIQLDDKGYITAILIKP